MPDHRPTRRDPPPSREERPDEPPRPSGPLWARAVHTFYDPSFDIRSRAEFKAALNDYVLLSPEERAFHDTHLLYRLVTGLESVYGVLRRIEARLDDGMSPDLSALEHLGPISEALAEIASNQPNFVQVGDWDGADEPDEDPAEQTEEPEEELADDDDPDFIYDTIPEDEPPATSRRRRRPPEVGAPRGEPTRAEPARAEPARAEPARQPARQADPEREALVGDLVPAHEGPQGAEAGGR